MWWIISLILIAPLMAEALATTVFVIIMLNGYPRLPDGMAALYMLGVIGLIPTLSLLAGFTAHKWAALRPIPLWASGILTGLAALLVYPPLLIALTFVLLAAFGML